MGNKLISWILEIFKKVTGTNTKKALSQAVEDRKAYEDTSVISFTSVFANALANKAVSDSTCIVEAKNGGESAASDVVKTVLDLVWDNMKEIVDGVLGKGGMFLIPYINGDRVYVAEVDQTDVDVLDTNGAGEVLSMTVLKAKAWVGSQEYHLLMDFTLENKELTIKHIAVDQSGEPVALDTVTDWADIDPELHFSNVERMPMGYVRCPKTDRKTNTFYGVPITYGAEDTMRQLHECLEQIEKEYKNKRVFVGADSMLFDGQGNLPDDGVFKVFQTGGSLNGGTFWQLFDPAIRDSSYYNRYASLCLQLEREVGTSRGILTEPAPAAATATEIRAANKATFDVVDDIRKSIKKAFENLAYAIDMYGEYAGLIPGGNGGDYKVTFDWDMSMIESTEETFNQLSELQSRGGCSLARLNSFVTGQSIEDAQAEIDEVMEQTMSMAQALREPQETEPKVE